MGILAILGFGGAYLYYRHFLGEELTPLRAAKIIPQEAVMASFISTDAQDWAKLSALGTPEAQKIFSQNWQKIEQEITPGSQDINYQQDIQPWLGGIMLAILPSSQGRVDYDLLTIVGIKDKFKAGNFLRKLKKQPDIQVKESKYKDLTIYEYTNNQTPSVWATIFKNYLVVSSDKIAVEQVIDTFKGEASLAEQNKFTAVLSEQLNLKNPLVHIYLLDYSSLVQKAVNKAITGGEIPPKTKEELQDINSVVMGLGIEEKGIHFQGIAKFTTPIEDKGLQPGSGKLISKMPANTILMVNGQTINRAWSQIEEKRDLIPELNELISQAKTLTKQWLNLDLDRDILAWMDGEFAVGILAVDNESDSFARTGLGGLVLIETSDHQTAETSIDKLENFSNKFPLISIEEQDIQGIAVTEWKTMQAPILSYGWLNNSSLMMSVGTEFSPVNQQNNLLNNETFTVTTKSLPKKNFGYVYFDIEKSLSLANNLSPEIPDSLPEEADAILNSVKAIALTTSIINPHTTQIDLFLSVKTMSP